MKRKGLMILCLIIAAILFSYAMNNIIINCIDFFIENVTWEETIKKESIIRSDNLKCDIGLLSSDKGRLFKYKVYLYDYDVTPQETYHNSLKNDIKINRLNFNISESERDYIERVVMAECGNQEYRGMLGVVQTIVDRAEILGISPYEVVTMPKQYAKAWSYASEEIKQAVSEVLDDGVRIWNFKVTSFHSGSYPKSWGKLLFIETIQDHHFYTWYKESEI